MITPATTEFTWPLFQQSIVEEDMAILTRLPAMLALLSATIDLVKQIQPGHQHLQGVVETITHAPNALSPTETLTLLKKFQNIRSMSKYIKKGEDLMQRKEAVELVNLSDIVSNLL